VPECSEMIPCTIASSPWDPTTIRHASFQAYEPPPAVGVDGHSALCRKKLLRSETGSKASNEKRALNNRSGLERAFFIIKKGLEPQHYLAEPINAGRRTSLVPVNHGFHQGHSKHRSTPRLDARFSLAKKFPSLPINPSVSINFLRFEYP
jgi:hypothetical protein